MQNLIDIDAVIEDVKKWDIHTQKLQQENEDLKKQIFFLEKRCELSINSEAQAKCEADQLRKVIAVMQETIESQSKAEEDNYNGKKEIKKLKDNEDYMQNLMRKKEQEVGEKMDAIKELHLTEVEKIKKDYEQQIKNLKMVHQDSLEEKSEIVNTLKKKIVDLEREKQTETMMLRLEYDEKVQRLQKQLASTSQPNNSSSSSLKNEILRKKLQHVQSEAEKEISALKSKISELEKCINQQQQLQKKRKLSFH